MDTSGILASGPSGPGDTQLRLASGSLGLSLLDHQLAAKIAKFAWCNEGLVRHFDHVKLTVEAFFPKSEEFSQDGKTGGYIKLLPDIALQ